VIGGSDMFYVMVSTTDLCQQTNTCKTLIRFNKKIGKYNEIQNIVLASIFQEHFAKLKTTFPRRTNVILGFLSKRLRYHARSYTGLIHNIH